MDFQFVTDIVQWIEGRTGDPLVSRVLIALALLAITALAARLLSRFVRKLFLREDAALAESSFYFTLIKAAVWIFGVCVVLDSCFNVNMSALIAALGVGGIAVSLGFQDTLSNLFGGAAITLTGVLKPGDNIQVSSFSGVVQDIRWRHTALMDAAGEIVYVPNSVMSKNPVVILASPKDVSVAVVITNNKPLDQVAQAIEKAAAAAAAAVVEVTKAPSFSYSDIKHYGVEGAVSLTIGDESKADAVVDAVVRAVEPLVR